MSDFIYYFVAAFVSSVILIILAKVVLCKPMRRPLDYYEADEEKEEMRMLRIANLRKREDPDGIHSAQNGGRE